MDSLATNYLSAAETDDDSCEYNNLGCSVSDGTLNFDSVATQ
jgi:hypothetical protein